MLDTLIDGLLGASSARSADCLTTRWPTSLVLEEMLTGAAAGALPS